jgi:hypothetical protein
MQTVGDKTVRNLSLSEWRGQSAFILRSENAENSCADNLRFWAASAQRKALPYDTYLAGICG